MPKIWRLGCQWSNRGAPMADLKLKCVTQPAGYAWVVGWKYEIFKEGDEDPFAIGYYFGTRAEADASALRAQQRLLDEWKGNGQ
jgi:hypothetical protein